MNPSVGMTTAGIQIIADSPNIVVVAMDVTLLGSPVTACPLLRTSAIPRSVLIIASVTMNDGILKVVDNKPLTVPVATPMSNPINRARTQKTSYCTMRSAHAVLTSAIADPTLRSKSPAIITTVRPAAASARGAAFTNMFVTLLTVNTLRDEKASATHRIATGTSRRRVSQLGLTQIAR